MPVILSETNLRATFFPCKEKTDKTKSCRYCSSGPRNAVERECGPPTSVTRRRVEVPLCGKAAGVTRQSLKDAQKVYYHPRGRGVHKSFPRGVFIKRAGKESFTPRLGRGQVDFNAPGPGDLFPGGNQLGQGVSQRPQMPSPELCSFDSWSWTVEKFRALNWCLLVTPGAGLQL